MSKPFYPRNVRNKEWREYISWVERNATCSSCYTYKGAVMIHVQDTHSTGLTVMCPWRLWLRTKSTKSIILKGIFCDNWKASPWYFYRCSRRPKCCQAEARDSTNSQNSCYHAVENTTAITNRENNWENCPNTSTC